MTTNWWMDTQPLNDLWPDENWTLMTAVFALKAPAHFPPKHLQTALNVAGTWWTVATCLTGCISCRNLSVLSTRPRCTLPGQQLVSFHGCNLSLSLSPNWWRCAAYTFRLNCALSAPSTRGRCGIKFHWFSKRLLHFKMYMYMWG